MEDDTTPQDANAMPPASDGSASDSSWRFGNTPRRDEWIAEALKASFFGVPVGELSRTEMLAAFGAIISQRIMDQELADSVRRMFAAAKRVE